MRLLGIAAMIVAITYAVRVFAVPLAAGGYVYGHYVGLW